MEKEISELSFEEAIKEMEQIIDKMEKENLPLKEATALFSRASELAKFAQAELSKASGKLFLVKKELDSITEEEQ